MALMDREHPQWAKFLDRLGKACDIREDDDGKPTWTCWQDHRQARAILANLGLSELEIEESCAWFDANVGDCDCEIVFNCEDASASERDL